MVMEIHEVIIKKREWRSCCRYLLNLIIKAPLNKKCVPVAIKLKLFVIHSKLFLEKSQLLYLWFCLVDLVKILRTSLILAPLH